MPKILDIIEQFGKETGKFQIVRCSITEIDKGDEYYNDLIDNEDTTVKNIDNE